MYSNIGNIPSTTALKISWRWDVRGIVIKYHTIIAFNGNLY